MPSGSKEEDKIETTIRRLLKLPYNRRCINCNNAGPQYVCTNFWTFVCTNCGGMHREFTHRVKSISMAKFTAEEVGALQARGNQRAKEIYLKDWDPHRHSFPDSSDLQRLREFIKHVYIDRKYSDTTRSRNVDRPTRLIAGDREEFFEEKVVTTHGTRSKSPCNDDKPSPGEGNHGRSFRYYYDKRRSPRIPQEGSRHRSHKRSSVRFEVVDDRVQDVGLGSGRHSLSTRFSIEELKDVGLGSGQPSLSTRFSTEEPKKEKRPKDAPAIQVNEVRKANDEQDNGTSNTVDMQDTCSSGEEPAEGNSDHKVVASRSLIDFNTEAEPANGTAVPVVQKNSPSTDSKSWASFETSQKKESGSVNTNIVECLLSELSFPATLTSGATAEVPTSTEASLGTLPEGKLSLPAPGAPPATSAQWQPRNSSFAPNVQIPGSTDQLSQSAPESTSEFGLQPPAVEGKSSARKELPADLFTASYSSVPTQALYWQTGPPQTMGDNAQYHPSMMPAPALHNAAKSTNPFDLSRETTQLQNETLVSMDSVQGALPEVAVLTSSASSSLFMPTQLLSNASSTYMGQQVLADMSPARLQNFGNIGNLGSVDISQQLGGRTSVSTSSNYFASVGRNPFS